MAAAPVERPTGAELPPTGFDLDGHLAEVERQILLTALAQSAGVRTDAAKLLRMSFRSFRYRLAKYGLSESGDADDGVVEDIA
jgi:two-component system response regulator PilR (NtrC family)